MKFLFIAALVLLLSVTLVLARPGYACSANGCVSSDNSDQGPLRGGGSKETESILLILVLMIFTRYF